MVTYLVQIISRGIPLIMPGENAGPADGPALGYLKALEGFDRQFPAFEHDSHGVDAAQMAAETATKAALVHGLKSVDVMVKGPGSGREAAIRALQACARYKIQYRTRHRPME